MDRKSTKLRAIDLYSGVGGWSLGLRLANVEVVASYEKWGPANETNFKNNFHQAQTVDIRRLALADQLADVVLAAKDVDPEWVAKCAVQSARPFGGRSVVRIHPRSNPE